MPRKKTPNPKPTDREFADDLGNALVIIDDRDAFIRQALTDWALQQFRESRPCSLTDDHARSLRDRAGKLYDVLIAPLED